MRERKKKVDKNDRRESGIFWNAVGNSTLEDQRKEVRQERVMRDMLWSYDTDKERDKFKGAIIDESDSGLCILTLAPIKVGSILRIYGDGRVTTRGATVIWCRKGCADIYKSGLSLGEL